MLAMTGTIHWRCNVMYLQKESIQYRIVNYGIDQIYRCCFVLISLSRLLFFSLISSLVFIEPTKNNQKCYSPFPALTSIWFPFRCFCFIENAFQFYVYVFSGCKLEEGHFCVWHIHLLYFLNWSTGNNLCLTFSSSIDISTLRYIKFLIFYNLMSTSSN